MKVLIADDDPVAGRAAEKLLIDWGYEVILHRDGATAWNALQEDDPPRICLLDWMMPGLDGPSVCRKIRALNGRPSVYIILLTVKGEKEDLIRGLESRADDYIVKPFDPNELRVRIRAGRRIIEQNMDLAAANARLERVNFELAEILQEVKILSGLLPICASCKKIRDDGGDWRTVEDYVCRHSEAQFTHGICPQCAGVLYPELSLGK